MSKTHPSFEIHCTCGASWSLPPMSEAKRDQIKSVWLEVHSGEGHAECDKHVAARARKKAARKERY